MVSGAQGGGMVRLLVAVGLCAALALPAGAQVRTPGQGAVSENEGSIGEDSPTIGEVSKPVGDGLSIGDTSRGPIGSGPMSDLRTRSMLSGPMSSISSGPMSAGRSMTGGPSMTEASAGAVKHDTDAPLGQRISAPLRELAPLQDQLKRLRTEGNAAAIEAAAAPVSAPVDAEAHEAAPLDGPADEQPAEAEPFDDAVAEPQPEPEAAEEYADAPQEAADAEAAPPADPALEATEENVADHADPPAAQ